MPVGSSKRVADVDDEPEDAFVIQAPGKTEKRVSTRSSGVRRSRHGEQDEDNSHADEDNDDDITQPPAILSRHQREQAQLEALFKRFAVRNWIFLFLLGLINNFHYNLVIAGANTLASSYGMKSLVALISFTNVFFGIIARIANAFVANRVAYNLRMTLMSIGTLIGLFFVSLSGPFGRGNNVSSFVVLLVGVAFTGTSYCYGESVALTFVQRYPPKTVGAWGSGTGISGVIASLLFLFLTNAGLSEQTIFLISMPLAVCYWLVFNFGIVAPHKVVMVTEPGKTGELETYRVVLHSGHEEKIARALHARLSANGGTVSDPEYKMIINFRGLSWKSIPPPPSEQVAEDVEHEEAHFAASRRHSTLSEQQQLAWESNEPGVSADAFNRAARKPRRSANAKNTQSSSSEPSEMSPRKSRLVSSAGLGEGVVEPGFPSHDGELQRAPSALSHTPHEDTLALAAGAHTHGDDLYYPCCRALCGCYSRECALRRWWRMHGQVIGTMHNAMLWYTFNLAVVYITEYAAQFMAPFSFYCRADWEDNFWIKNSYTVTQFCYQFGVFISRSSLTFGLHIPFVGVLSIIQVCNAVLWFVQAKVMFIASHTSQSKEVGLAFLLFVWMLFVGLVGGASYVNVFYLILCKGRKMQAHDEAIHSVELLRKLRGDKEDDRSVHRGGGAGAGAGAGGGEEDTNHSQSAAVPQPQQGVASAEPTNPAVSSSPPVVSVRGRAPREGEAEEEEDPAFGPYSQAEGGGAEASDEPVAGAGLDTSQTKPVSPKKKSLDTKGSTVDGRPLRSSSSSSDDDEDAAAAAVALGDDEDDRNLHTAALLSRSADLQTIGSPTTAKPGAAAASGTRTLDALDELNAAAQSLSTESNGREEAAAQHCLWRWLPAGVRRRLFGGGQSDREDVVSISDFKPLAPHEETELEELSVAVAEEWQSRRELAMAIGSLYAMVGICIGTILDVIFTNTVLKGTVTCS